MYENQKTIAMNYIKTYDDDSHKFINWSKISFKEKKSKKLDLDDDEKDEKTHLLLNIKRNKKAITNKDVVRYKKSL